MPELILDHQEGIKFDPETGALSNLQALFYLPPGLHQLALIVRQLEIRQGAEGVVFHMPGSLTTPMLPCAFHWFAVSLSNFLRLVGLVQLANTKSWKSSDLAEPTNSEEIRRHCTAYVRSVAPAVYTWRHKIGAHFALTDSKGENVATLEQSVMNPVSFLKPYYWAGKAVWNTGGHAAALPTWALTQEFESLAPRFWSSLKLPPLPK